MSYQSRKKCDLKHITGCGLCPQMFDCPYDKNENKSENIKTESEKQQLFDALAKENKRWDAEKKAIVDLPKDTDLSPTLSKCHIKPEPKYRPFKNAEECWNEMLKHQPFGYVKSKETLYGDVYHNIISVENDGVLITNTNKITDSTNSNFMYMFNAYEFIDGTPFGILEED